MALQIQQDKFEDDIMSEPDKNSSSHCSEVAFELPLNRFQNMLRRKDRVSDELKKSIRAELMSRIIKKFGFLSESKTVYPDLKASNILLEKEEESKCQMLQNSIEDKKKISFEDIECKHFYGVEKQQVQKLAELQNPGFMCFISFRSIDNKPYSLWGDEEQINTLSQGWENEPCVIHEFTQPLANDEKMTSKLQENFTRSNNLNKHKLKETKSRSYPKFQHKRKEIAQHVSFAVLLSIIFGGLSFDMWIQPSLMKVQHVSMWASLLGLLGFMVFIWAAATMILVGVPFIGIQCAVLIFWAILMHLKSYNSISVVFVPLAGIVFFEVFARGKV